MKEKLIYFLLTLLVILSSSGVQASINYIDRPCLFCPPTRDRVITSKSSEHTSYSKWEEKGSFDNRGNKKPASFTYSYQATSSRSTNVGASVNLEIIKFEIGGSTSFSKTDSFSGTREIPANKMGRAYIRNKITTVKFKHAIKREEKINKFWRSKVNERERVEYSTVVTTTPELKIDIN